MLISKQAFRKKKHYRMSWRGVNETKSQKACPGPSIWKCFGFFFTSSASLQFQTGLEMLLWGQWCVPLYTLERVNNIVSQVSTFRIPFCSCNMSFWLANWTFGSLRNYWSTSLRLWMVSPVLLDSNPGGMLRTTISTVGVFCDVEVFKFYCNWTDIRLRYGTWLYLPCASQSHLLHRGIHLSRHNTLI